jgi:hypothetical protein
MALVLNEGFHQVNIIGAANHQGSAVVQVAGHHRHNFLTTGAGSPPGLFHQKGQGGGFVEQAQFTLGLLHRARIKKHPALQQNAVEVRY